MSVLTERARQKTHIAARRIQLGYRTHVVDAAAAKKELARQARRDKSKK